ncbi:MAG: ATP-binding protein [Thermoleophilaceae bacterium]|nr:ATP-binding protein [Thermoleophilaceae bacterium]
MGVDLFGPSGASELRRALREASQVVPLGWSGGGRRFSFQAPLTVVLPAGGYVLLSPGDDRRYLGQILDRAILERAGASWTLDVDSPEVKQAQVEVPIRLLEGSGELLARVEKDGLTAVGADESFREADLEPAPETVVERYLDGLHSGSRQLDIGRALDAAGRARLRADGFARHTFLCGQSGAGKTFALGVILERLLLETDLPLVILDPNGDFTGLGSARAREEVAVPAAGLLERYRSAAAAVRVFSRAHEPLRLRFADLAPEMRAAVVGLDPLADREEYGAFLRLAEGRDSLAAVRDAAIADLSAEGRLIALRIGNLGVADWALWAQPGEASVLEVAGQAPATVVDLSSLDTPAEQALAAGAVLGTLWERRADRRPLLVVIDEAHNVCPARPASALQGVGRDHVVRIAGEGRKYGLHLLLVTQRPEKLEPNALTQCDNLVLMRLNGAADVAGIASAFSFVPPSLLAEAPSFGKGEALLAGGIAGRPSRAAFEGRLSPEGGGDVPTTWAR